MKKTKLVLIILTLASSLAFANFSDVPRSHWSSDAVRNLYNKGLLSPTLDDAEIFNGEGVFSRYEIAAMLYFNLEYMTEKLNEKGSADDVIALKALLADFAPELVKMGAKQEELEKKLDDIAKNIEKKLGRKVDKIDELVRKVKISGEFEAEQEIGMKDNDPGMGSGLDFDGTLSILGNVNKNVSVVTKFDVEEGENIEVKTMELKAKSSNFNISYFRDQDKDPESLLTFTNNLSLFDGKAVAPKEGILFNGKFDIGKENKLIDSTYVGMFFPTSSGDFYGGQLKNDLLMLKKYNLDSYVRLSYTEKIVNYQYDEGDKDNPDNARALYSIDTGLSFKPMPIWDAQVRAEYATRRSPGIENVESDEDTAFVKSRDAIYLYTANRVKVDGVGTFKGNFGLYNSGEYFDIAGLGTNSTKVFSDSESEIVEMQAGKKAFMTKLTYDLFSKGKFITDFNYSTYGSNVEDILPEKAMRTTLTYNAIPGKLKFEGLYLLEKDDREISDATDEEIEKAELEEEDGRRTLEARSKVNMVRWAEQNVRLALIDDLDKDNKEDTDNKIEFYVDNVMTIKNMELKVAGLIEKEGLGLENYDADENGTVDDDEHFESDGVFSFDSGVSLEISDLKYKEKDMGVVTLGMRYNFEDEEGTEGNKEENDTSGFSFSASHEIEFGNLTVTYGGKFEKDKEYDSDSDDVKDTDDSDDLVYAIGLEYDFGDEVIAKISYGDPSVTNPDEMTEENFVLRKTAFAEGEQDQMTLSIEASF